MSDEINVRPGNMPTGESLHEALPKVKAERSETPGPSITSSSGWCAPSEAFFMDLPPVVPVERGGVLYGRDGEWYPRRRSAIGGRPSRRRMMKRIRKQERELAQVYARLRRYERERRAAAKESQS